MPAYDVETRRLGSPPTSRRAESARGPDATLADVDLPVMPPVRPMLAKSVKGIPDPGKHSVGDVPGLSFEPKWDLSRPVVRTR